MHACALTSGTFRLTIIIGARSPMQFKFPQASMKRLSESVQSLMELPRHLVPHLDGKSLNACM